MTTVRALLASAAAALSDIGDSPAIDAQVLLAHALERDRSWLFAWPEHTPPPAQQAAFSTLVARRRDGEPIAYLTGRREFWSLDLAVSAHTLIPRPETELLVEQVLALDLPADAQVVDLGTGSGASALGLATERPGWQVSATDASIDALAVARNNARRLNLPQVRFHHGDWFGALPSGQRFAAIVSNPPYVGEHDAHLCRGDVRFEPREALAAGPDGLDDIRRLIACAPGFLAPGGWLWLEHGADQAAAIRRLFATAGLDRIETQRDLAGRERCTGGCLKPK